CCLSRIRRVSGVRHVGGLSERLLYLRSLHLPFLLTRDLRQLPTRVVGWETALVSKLSPFFAGAANSLDTRRLPPYLLLLPRCLLQVILGRSTSVCRGRAAQDIFGRTKFSADPAEFPSQLFTALLPRLGLPRVRRR